MFSSNQSNAAAAAAVNYIEEVFSTDLYAGTGAALTISNNIDLSTKGGLVWIRRRDTSENHQLFDTVRGANYRISSNTTNAGPLVTDHLNSFNSTGFTLGANGNVNDSAGTYASWTFREQAKFFDVVTWSGNTSSSNRRITHNLQATPAFIIIKNTTNVDYWYVYTASTGTNGLLLLNTTDAVSTGGNPWSTVAPTSTDFGYNENSIGNSGNWVGYLFASNAGGFGLTGTDNVISCGTWTGNTTVNLGYEPQWVLIKRTDSTSNWFLLDVMRRWTAGGILNFLLPNSSAAESTDAQSYLTINSTGFAPGSDTYFQTGTFIYIAIRRGPMKVPSTGSSVFYPNTVAQANSPESSGVPFPPDLVNSFTRDGTDRTSDYDLFQFADRLRGLGTPNNVQSTQAPSLFSSNTAVEANTGYIQLKADSQNITRGAGWNSASYGNWIYYFWRRAPSFFDVVCYTGTGVATAFSHNLTVVPELMIVKRRNAANNWAVYATSLGNTNRVFINQTQASAADSTLWNNTTPTSSVFTVGTAFATNNSGNTYVAYLFATCAGISKVGSYTGTGTTLQINCGFTAGARFVLIKRTDSTGDWYVWDTARGIIAGNDPYLLLNSTAAEVTSTDYIDTYSAGFEISSTAPAAINGSGGTFIFLAIA